MSVPRHSPNSHPDTGDVTTPEGAKELGRLVLGIVIIVALVGLGYWMGSQ